MVTLVAGRAGKRPLLFAVAHFRLGRAGDSRDPEIAGEAAGIGRPYRE
jgi:hypothetical protein